MKISASTVLAVVLILTAGLRGWSASAQDHRVLQQYQASRWSSEGGLASGRISSISQTPDGYLWLGTEKGLVRFDGFEYRTFPMASAGGGEPRILDLAVDRGGALWIRTEDARLLRYDGHTFSSVLSPQQGEGVVLALAPAYQGGLLIAGLKRGVTLIKGSTLTDVPIPEASSVVSLAQTSDGLLWTGTRDGSLNRYDGGSQAPLRFATLGSKVNCLFPDTRGGLWIGTDRGLAYWDRHTLQQIALPARSVSTQVLSIMEDRQKNVWVGTAVGLFRYSEGAAQWVLHDGTAVSALLQGREGDIWYGDGATLVRLRSTPWIAQDDQVDKSLRRPGAIFEDHQHRLWVAPLDGGLVWLQNGAVHKVSVAGIDKDVVYSIDGQGDEIWLGRQRGGLTRLVIKGKRLSARSWTPNDGLVQDSIYSVLVLRDGAVWACSLTHGVSRLLHGQFTNYDRQVLGSDTVQAVAQTMDGTIVFATTKGLRFFKNDQWESAPSPHELTTLLADEKNGLWVGGRYGLQYVNSERESIPVRGVAGEVNGLAFGSHGILLVGTSQNLYSLKLAAFFRGDNSGQLRSFLLSDGLPSTSLVSRSRAMISGDDHAVWASTSAGLAFATGIAGTESAPVLAHVDGANADGVALTASQDNVRVPPESRRVIFHIVGLDLQAPEHVRLRYMLEGFDRSWSEPTTGRDAVYTALPPGTYHFHVAAENSDGRWNGVAANVGVIVQPTWFQRKAVRFAAFALIALSGIAAYRTRLRAVAKQAEARAEERSSERTRIARELHDTLLQNILGSILQLHVAAESLPEESQTQLDLNRVILRMEDAAEEARTAVQNLREADASALPLQAFFADLAKRLNLLSSAAIEFNVDGRERPTPFAIREEVAKVGSEAVSNALRHSGATSIKVLLTFRRSELRLTVSDDGCGVQPHLLTATSPGHYGLAGMRERADSVQGDLHIQSALGEGTTLRLSVPAKVAYATARERGDATE